MGILSFFTRSKPALPCIEHPVFGPMEATLLNDDGSYFWETPDAIPTKKGPISVFLDGPINGPTEEQAVLWGWIFDNSERLAKSVEQLLIDRLKDVGLERHINDLVWSAVGLPADGDRHGAWDLSFTLLADAGHYTGAILTAYFIDGIPTGVVNFDN